MRSDLTKLLCFVALGVVLAQPGMAARRNLAGYSTTTFPANDDQSVGPIAPGFSMNFFGTTYTQFWVNNNGNVTFASDFGTFTPTGLLSVGQPIIAPFFADV